MAVSYSQDIYKISHNRRYPDSNPYTRLEWAGYCSRKGVNGLRIALTNGGYVYYLPTNYTRDQDFYCVVRRYKWTWYNRKLQRFLEYEGPHPLTPNASSYDLYFTDTAYGVNPKAAAIAKAYNAVRSNAVNFAMLTKDLYDATKLAGSYFERLNKAIPFLLRKKFRKAYQAFTGSHKIPKGMANSWLEFQWGVRPSIEAVQNSFKRATTDPARVIRITGGGQSEMIALPKVDGSNVNHDFDGYVRYLARCRVYRYYKNIAQLEAAAFNPIEPAWDAIPWSFLVGWFAPIEDYLYQFAFVPSWIQVQGCDSVKYTTEYHIQQIRYCPTRFANGFPGNNSTMTIPIDGNRIQMSFSRTPATGLVRPMQFGELLARSEIGVTCKRLISASALATQRLT